jgi:hypothetical protein
MPHIDVAILRSIVASLGTKVVELQPMSLMGRYAQFRSKSRDWLGTFWAHSLPIEVNSGESQSMSFRSSVPVRLSDQPPETGSIPGSSTEKLLVRDTNSDQFSYAVEGDRHHLRSVKGR